jgi:O-antigen ligase
MNKIKEYENIGAVIGILAACTTLAISPGYSYDAFSAVKLLFISMLGAVSGFYVFRHLKNINQRLGKFTTAVIVVLLLNTILVLVFSKINIYQAFYGVGGRYTGFLTYFSLYLALTATAISSSFFVRKIILNIFIFCGILSVFYTLFQFSGRDFVNWDTSGVAKVIGFLGNPNFISSFLALIATAVFAKLIGAKNSLVLNFLYALIILGACIGLIGADSTQGFLVAILGFAIVLIFYSRYKFKSRIPSHVILASLLFGVIVAILDIFKKVPWDPILYSETISIRGDYWRAGWNMALANPVFGVGFDGYLNHYRRSRDLTASTRLGSDIPVDAAHNVLIDYAANGGFLFFILNLILLGIILKSGISYLRKLEKFDPNFVSIFAVWIGFTTQSIISINQLGLAVWGWILGGLILGAKYNEENISSPSNLFTGKKKFETKNFTSIVTLVAVLGSIVSLPILLTDHKFKLALDNKQALDLFNSANSWPPITKRMVFVSAVLDQNRIHKEAKILSKRILEINPDSFEGWIIYSQNPLVSELEMVKIKQQLLRLDPNLIKLGGIDKYIEERFETNS